MHPRPSSPPSPSVVSIFYSNRHKYRHAHCCTAGSGEKYNHQPVRALSTRAIFALTLACMACMCVCGGGAGVGDACAKLCTLYAYLLYNLMFSLGELNENNFMFALTRKEKHINNFMWSIRYVVSSQRTCAAVAFSRTNFRPVSPGLPPLHSVT